MLIVYIMKCPECNSENDDGSNFCVNCGSKLKINNYHGVFSSKNFLVNRMKLKLLIINMLKAVMIQLIHLKISKRYFLKINLL